MVSNSPFPGSAVAALAHACGAAREQDDERADEEYHKCGQDRPHARVIVGMGARAVTIDFVANDLNAIQSANYGTAGWKESPGKEDLPAGETYSKEGEVDRHGHERQDPRDGGHDESNK